MKDDAWVKLPRGLLESAAWRSLGINARRFVDFLLIEHMRHGGRENGKLLAPRRQLEKFGIGAHHVTGAIEECERVGLVDCQRGVGRRPSVYALTWLPRSDGSAPCNRWTASGSDCQTAVATNDCQIAALGCCQTAVTKAVVTAKRQSQRPK